MLKKDYPTGIIIYEGPSQIDGEPIVVIVNGFQGHDNDKIDDMIQAWIIRADIHPQDAIKNLKDYSICGDCKHREFRSCYVNVMFGPAAVYRAYKRGSYSQYVQDMDKFFVGKKLRLGAYGDPAAVPTSIWKHFCSITDGHTGYTHRWKKCDPELKNYCMASVDSIANYFKEYEQAQALGWRTFRIRCFDNSPILKNEFICPASKEGGKRSSCSKCRACSGLSSNMKNPVIVIHGWKHKIRYYIEGMKKILYKKKYRRAKLVSNVTA